MYSKPFHHHTARSGSDVVSKVSSVDGRRKAGLAAAREEREEHGSFSSVPESSRLSDSIRQDSSTLVATHGNPNTTSTLNRSLRSTAHARQVRRDRRQSWNRYDRKLHDLEYWYSAGPTRVVPNDHLRLLDSARSSSVVSSTSALEVSSRFPLSKTSSNNSINENNSSVYEQPPSVVESSISSTRSRSVPPLRKKSVASSVLRSRKIEELEQQLREEEAARLRAQKLLERTERQLHVLEQMAATRDDLIRSFSSPCAKR